MIETFNDEVVKALLKRRGADIETTRDVVMAVAANRKLGAVVMKLLLDRRGVDVPITEGVVKAWLLNISCGEAVIEFLLGRRGTDEKSPKIQGRC